MNRGDSSVTRSARRRNPSATEPRGGRIAALLRRCGLVSMAGQSGFRGCEQLEGRVLMADDHPNFGQVFNTPTPAPVVNIVLNGQGIGAASGVIDYIPDNDMFRFTAPTTDFVTVWADTINEETGVSVLDSMVQVYRRNPNNSAVLIGTGRDSDLLTGGFNTDGWFGFVAQAGVEYFVRVLSQVTSGAAALGAYVVRIDALTEAFNVDPATGQTQANITGAITLTGNDRVFRFTTPNDPIFNSLITFGDKANPLDFDSRLDIYSATGVRVASDSQAGRLNNPFTTVRGAPNTTYYVRLRSDAFNPTDPTALGTFGFAVDAAATRVDLDPVVRQGAVAGSAGGQNSALFDFISQGTGQSFITVIPFGLPPLQDPAVHLYDDTGAQIAFNDDFAGLSAQIEIVLQGGVRYFVVVEGFDVANAGGFALVIEANHTINPAGPSLPDDHENLPAGFETPAVGTPAYDAVRRAFERATPLVWGDPRLYTDPAGNPFPDRSFVVDAFGTGRIFPAADSDLFQFTPQIDMLGSYAGNNDDGGTALYLGGAFQTAGNINQTIRGGSPNVSVWDANDYFPALRGLNGPVNALARFDFDGDNLDELYVGGSFTLAGNTADPSEDIPVNNIARFAFNPLSGQFEWSAMGNVVNGTVYALTMFDAEAPTGGGPDPDPVLVIGGAFTNPGSKLAQFNGLAIGAFAGAPTITGTVYALTSFDAPDPDGNEPLPDPINALIVGGDFTATIPGGTATDLLMLGAGANVVLGTPTSNGTNGVVRALEVFQPIGQNSLPYLIVGGNFSQVRNGATITPVNNIARFGAAAVPGPGTTLGWAVLGGGVTGGTTPTVYALKAFDAGDLDGDDPDPVVVVGGSFTTAGGAAASNIARWNDATGLGGNWTTMGQGFNGAVRALAAFSDEQEPGTNDVANGYAGPQLYAAGDFTQMFTPLGPAAATHLAIWDRDPIFGAFGWGGGDGNGGMETGTDGTINALIDFDDGNPNLWDRHDRPSTRLRVTVSGELGSFINSFINVYDSNFNLIYSNDTIAPPFPDPSGMIDPSLTVADLGELAGIQVWGGQVYYLEVVTVGNTGRYSVAVTADAFVHDDSNSAIGEPVGTGAFGQATELVLVNATGDTRNFLAPVNAASTTRFYHTAPADPTDIANVSELDAIHNPFDTDMYFFRSPQNGTTEIRINTTQLADQFAEFFNGALENQLDTNYRSFLDAVLIVYNNDFEVVARSDDSAAIRGEYDSEFTGTLGFHDHFRRDPYVAFDVVAGERYFVEIRSAALEDLLAGNLGEIDWRTTQGSYELLINSMANFGFTDDHEDNIVELATVLGLGQDPGTSNNGQASITGQIVNNLANPFDTDLFSFLAVASGPLTVTLTPTSGSLRGFLRVFDQNLLEIGSAQASSGGQVLNVTAAVTQGRHYYVLVSGQTLTGPETQGPYTVSLNGPAYADDYGSPFKWSSAHDIAKDLYDFDGTESLSGSIESAGDVDIFKFTTIDFDFVTVDVVRSGQFDPFVRVYEVSEDPVGNAVFMQIAFNDDIAFGNLNSRASFPVSGPDRTSSISGRTYNYYYIVVSGFDPEATSGNYTLTLTLNPTDDHADTGQFGSATDIPLGTSTGLGSDTGIIELTGDTDFFRLTALAGGSAIITVTAPDTSALRQGVRIFDGDFQPVADLISGQFLVLGSDAPSSTATFRFNVVRGVTYFIHVQGGPLNGGFVNHTAETGAFSVGVTSPPLDDHANESEFPFATIVPLSILTGDGTATGQVNPNTDTDLFRINAIADGNLRISIDTPNSFITPVLRLFQGTNEIGTAVVDGGPGDEDGLLNGSVTRTITGGEIGDVFYFLVSSSATGFSGTGAYTATVLGNKPPITGTDDHANEDEWDDATLVPLEPLTGDAAATGGIQFNGDTDLFTFTSLGAGRAFVQVVTPAGQPLDLAVRIFNQNRQEIAFDQSGIPGANANISFNVTGANQQYFVLVQPSANGTGTYTVRLDAPAEMYRLYYPEGFASPTIREFVALSNPNTTTVRYTIRLRYEDPALPEVVVAQNATIAPGQRGGVTLSNGTANPLFGIVFNKPYAIVVESDGPLGASMSHYDFGTTIGESFTARASTFWAFPRGERFPGAVRDFLLVYNPNPTAAVVTLSAFRADGTTVTFQQTVGAFRRGGWAFNQLTTLPLGSFAFTVSSAPATTGQTHIGIVAALSHYDLVNDAGDAMLGDPDGGTTRGVIPGVTSGPNNFAQISIFNPGNTTANVVITGTYLSGSLPSFVRNIAVAARSAVTLTGTQLAFVDNQTLGLRFSSNVNVAFFARERQQTEGNATLGAAQAGTRFFFGDAFISTPQAGIRYFENLYFYNPDAAGVNVSVRLLFTNGDTSEVSVFVGADGFARLRLHQLPEILSRGGNQFFALDISAARPFVVAMDHYDLFLNGGWGATGAPLGLTNALSTIS
ncbi:MAG: hypothetical protein ACKVU4_12215 [Phycisphaerales bacterium]